MGYRIYLISGLLFLLTIACPAQVRQIDALLKQYEALDQFSGSILVAKKGKVMLLKGYGLANREWNIPATPSTRYRIASLTKQFTAALIMQLKDEGKIDLHATVDRYLAWYPSHLASKITIHHLLTHSSGLPNYTDRPNFFIDESYKDFSMKAFIERFCTDSLAFEPGARFHYSNSGYYILGAIIESVAGKSFQALLKEKILDVADMKNSGVDQANDIIPYRASGYDLVYGTYENAAFINSRAVIGASGDMYSTPEDLFLWSQAFLGNKLMTEKSKQSMLQPFLDNYAYGLGVVKIRIGNEKDSVTLIAHTGGINGFKAKILLLPGQDEVIIACGNTSDINSDIDISNITFNILLLLHGQKCPKPVPHVVTETAKIVLKRSVQDGIEFYKNIMDTTAYDYLDAEKKFSDFGHFLSNKGKQQDAIEILRFNTVLFPFSSLAYDSFADELEEDNQLEQAIINYKKALKIDPNNAHAKRGLERLIKSSTR